MTEFFASAGGTSQGAAVVPGLRQVLAANHSWVAMSTHAANFPEVEHDVADLSQVTPRRYRRTEILWASPECTWHALRSFAGTQEAALAGQRQLAGTGARSITSSSRPASSICLIAGRADPGCSTGCAPSVPIALIISHGHLCTPRLKRILLHRPVTRAYLKASAPGSGGPCSGRFGDARDQ
jgi:hypothetical protein